MPISFKKYFKLGVALFLLLVAVVAGKIVLDRDSIEHTLKIHISSIKTNDTIQVFYDTGRGFNEDESIRYDLAVNSLPTLVEHKFSGKSVKSIRLDPGNLPNIVGISGIDFDQHHWNPEDIQRDFTPVQFIEKTYFDNDIFYVATLGGDPILVSQIYLGNFQKRRIDLPFIFSAILLDLFLFFYIAFRTRITHLLKKNSVRKVFLSFFGIALSIQVLFFSYSLSQTVDNVAIVDSGDWDGARGIETSMRSGWLNNNGWAYYGNLYYRIANTLQKMDTIASNSSRSVDDEERSHHFSLLLLSLFGLVGISAVLAYAMSDNSIERVVLVILFNNLFFSNYFWSLWVFRVHPDVLLSFLTGLAFFLSAKYLLQKNWNLLLFSGVIWGLALATKLNTLIFLPPLLLLFMPVFSFDGFKKAVVFYFVIFSVYFIVGFPQNFKIVDTIEVLRGVSKSKSVFSIDSILAPLRSLKNETLIFLLPITLLSIVSVKREKFTIGNLIRLGFICIFPLAYLIYANMTIQLEHYFLPTAAVALVFLIFSLIFIIDLIWGKILGNKLVFFCEFRPIYLLIILSVIIFSRNNVSENLTQIYKDIGIGDFRNSARDLYETVRAYQESGIKIGIDPYVPYDRRLGNVMYSDSPTLQKMDLSQLEVLVLNNNYDLRFASEQGTMEWERTRPDWPEVRAFYLLFMNNSEYTDTYGKKWKRVREYKDGLWRVWEKEK